MSTKTCICIRSVLLANGLVHYIRLYAPESTIEIFPTFSELLNVNELQSSVVLIDTRLFGADPILGLEKIRKNIDTGQLIGIYDRILNDRVLPFFDHIIHADAGDVEIRNLFEKIYIPSEKILGDTEENRLISSRESEILKCVALGFTNKETADQLSISVHTVIAHRKNITFKLGIKTIAGLTVYAILNNIIKAEDIN